MELADRRSGVRTAGKDRANYGDQFITEIAEAASAKGLSLSNLRSCRQCYDMRGEKSNEIVTRIAAAPDRAKDSRLRLRYLWTISKQFANVFPRPTRNNVNVVT